MEDFRELLLPPDVSSSQNVKKVCLFNRQTRG
jgi:hypothetical protein